MGETNPYIAALLGSVPPDKTGGRAAALDATPAAPNGGLPNRVLQFVGFVHELPGGLWRVYTTPELDEGVEFPKADILDRSSVKGRDDGRVRDVVAVRKDADVIYWTRKRPKVNREPGGGSEYPII
jgi:hypothetical protein